jgi:glycosyltransferase involved in cell wall biosynthesis
LTYLKKPESISVIVIAKNAEKTLERALFSILAQQYKPMEILVVLGHSTDGSAELLSTFVGIRIVHQQDHGIARARNLGIKEANGSYISFLDADDAWMEDTLQVQMNYLLLHPDADAAVGQLLSIEPGKEVQKIASTPGGYLFRRSAFEKVGLFDVNLNYASEHAWFMKARRNGIHVIHHDTIVLKKYIHGHNLSIIQKTAYRKEWMELLREKL